MLRCWLHLGRSCSRSRSSLCRESKGGNRLRRSLRRAALRLRLLWMECAVELCGGLHRWRIGHGRRLGEGAAMAGMRVLRRSLRIVTGAVHRWLLLDVRAGRREVTLELWLRRCLYLILRVRLWRWAVQGSTAMR